MGRLSKEQRATLITKQQAIEKAALSLAIAAKIHGVAVTDIIDLVRALACQKVKETRKNVAQDIMQQIEHKTDLNFKPPISGEIN